MVLSSSRSSIFKATPEEVLADEIAHLRKHVVLLSDQLFVEKTQNKALQQQVSSFGTNAAAVKSSAAASVDAVAVIDASLHTAGLDSAGEPSVVPEGSLKDDAKRDVSQTQQGAQPPYLTAAGASAIQPITPAKTTHSTRLPQPALPPIVPKATHSSSSVRGLISMFASSSSPEPSSTFRRVPKAAASASAAVKAAAAKFTAPAVVATASTAATIVAVSACTGPKGIATACTAPNMAALPCAVSTDIASASTAVAASAFAAPEVSASASAAARDAASSSSAPKDVASVSAAVMEAALPCAAAENVTAPSAALAALQSAAPTVAAAFAAPTGAAFAVPAVAAAFASPTDIATVCAAPDVATSAPAVLEVAASAFAAANDIVLASATLDNSAAAAPTVAAACAAPADVVTVCAAPDVATAGPAVLEVAASAFASPAHVVTVRAAPDVATSAPAIPEAAASMFAAANDIASASATLDASAPTTAGVAASVFASPTDIASPSATLDASAPAAAGIAASAFASPTDVASASATLDDSAPTAAETAALAFASPTDTASASATLDASAPTAEGVAASVFASPTDIASASATLDASASAAAGIAASAFASPTHIASTSANLDASASAAGIAASAFASPTDVAYASAAVGKAASTSAALTAVVSVPAAPTLPMPCTLRGPFANATECATTARHSVGITDLGRPSNSLDRADTASELLARLSKLLLGSQDSGAASELLDLETWRQQGNLTLRNAARGDSCAETPSCDQDCSITPPAHVVVQMWHAGSAAVAALEVKRSAFAFGSPRSPVQALRLEEYNATPTQPQHTGGVRGNGLMGCSDCLENVAGRVGSADDSGSDVHDAAEDCSSSSSSSSSSMQACSSQCLVASSSASISSSRQRVDASSNSSSTRVDLCHILDLSKRLPTLSSSLSTCSMLGVNTMSSGDLCSAAFADMRTRSSGGGGHVQKPPASLARLLMEKVALERELSKYKEESVAVMRKEYSVLQSVHSRNTHLESSTQRLHMELNEALRANRSMKKQLELMQESQHLLSSQAEASAGNGEISATGPAAVPPGVLILQQQVALLRLQLADNEQRLKAMEGCVVAASEERNTMQRDLAKALDTSTQDRHRRQQAHLQLDVAVSHAQRLQKVLDAADG